MVMMGTIKPSKYQALVAGDSNMDSKGNKKDNEPPDQKGDSSMSHEESSNSKNKKYQRRKVKVKRASVHTMVRDFILTTLI